MSEKLILTKDEARQILWEDTEDFTIVSDEQVDSGRWSAYHDLVVKRASDQKLFRASYSVGLTESQDERPWEYEKQVTFTEVVAFETIVTAYKEAP